MEENIVMDNNMNTPKPANADETIHKVAEEPTVADFSGAAPAFSPDNRVVNFSKPGVVIAFIAAFLTFLLVCGSLFLPMMVTKSSEAATEKGFSIFELVKDEVSVVSDFIKSPFKPGYDDIITLMCAVLSAFILVIAFVKLISNIIFVIKRTHIPCQGIGTIVSMSLAVLAIFLINNGGYAYAEDGYIAATFGIGAFLMIGALILSAILSEILFDSYSKPSKTILTRKIVQLALVVISSVAVFAALGTGIGIEYEGLKAVVPIKEYLLNSRDAYQYLFILLSVYLVLSFVYGSVLENVGKRYAMNYGKRMFHRFGATFSSDLDFYNNGKPIVIANFIFTLLLLINNILITIECNKIGEGFVIPQILIISTAATFVCVIGLIICNAVAKENRITNR